MLEDLLLATQLGPFTRRAKRATVAHSRFYFFDAGVFRSLRPAGPLDRPEEIDGAAFEGLVFQHLRAWSSWGGSTKPGGAGRRELSFWRTRTGLEVDFVIYGRSEFVAVEVKNTAKVRESDLRGLRAFHDDFPQATLILLYRGTERTREHGVWCLPAESFLRALHPRRTLLKAAMAAD